MENNHPWVGLLKSMIKTIIICGSIVWTVYYGINRQFDMSLKCMQMYYQAQAADLKSRQQALWPVMPECWKWQEKDKKLEPTPDPLSEEKESKATKEKKFELLPVPNFEPEKELKPVPVPDPFEEKEWKPTPDSKKKEGVNDGFEDPIIPLPINRRAVAEDHSGFGPNPSPWKRAPRTFAPSD